MPGSPTRARVRRGSLVLLGQSCQFRDAHIEDLADAGDSAPRGILAPAFQVRDPGRMQLGSKRHFFLGQLALFARLAQRPSESLLRLVPWRHPATVATRPLLLHRFELK